MKTSFENFVDDISSNEEDKNLWKGNLSDRWSIGNTPNGGYSMAFAAKAISNSLAHKDPLSISANYLERLDFGESLVKVYLVNESKSMSTARAELIQDKKVKVIFTGTFTNFSKSNGLDLSMREEPKFDSYDDNFFEKKIFYDSEISVNQINKDFLDNLELLEPHGKGNEEPQFLIKDIVIDQVKNIKNKHILIFFKNDLGENLKGISFNSMNTLIGDYLLKFNKFKFHILCSIKKDNFSSSQMPQILIHDVKVIN